MSEFAHLKNGFVNWQGQRVFVPWFGAPRIVPSAADERRVLKLRLAIDYAPIVCVVLFIAIAWWAGGLGRLVEETVAALCLGLFALALLLERRWSSHWPHQSAIPFSRSRFMVGYYRTRPFGDRVWEFGWGVGGIFLVFRYFDLEFWGSVDSWNDRLDAMSALAVVGLLIFCLFRHTAVSAISLLPRARPRAVEGSE